jgi:hypothetical protein
MNAVMDFQAIVRTEIRAEVSLPQPEAEALGRELRRAVVKIYEGFYDYPPALVIQEFWVAPGTLAISFVGSLLGALILTFLVRALFGEERVAASFADAQSGQPLSLSPGFQVGRDFKFFVDYLKLNGFPGHYYHREELAGLLDRLVQRYETLAAA